MGRFWPMAVRQGSLVYAQADFLTDFSLYAD
jgi:hypothetical protein